MQSPKLIDLGSVALWTWVTFGLVAFILYKIAWKPVLAALDVREGRIRRSLEDAEKARVQLEEMEAARKQMLVDAEDETKAIISKARDAATEAANTIEHRAAEKVQIMYANADRDIEAMKAEATTTLRNEQVEMVINLASRVVIDNMDTEKNRKLADQLIAEI
ncbi:MAG: F0F1 ATP synthase subunit B [Verrucomicrobia bacterium]|nr:F0F1 ATP synthase subunit B [Verrucomicrobiota bacterium]MDA1085869.1 F0F1 ATP synthase subunit B [Verrucomicrobiota bacterium]